MSAENHGHGNRSTSAKGRNWQQETRKRAENEAKLKAEKEAKEKAEKEAKEKAEKEAKEQADAEAKAAHEKAEKEAKAKADAEAKVKADADAKAAQEKAEKEAKAKADAEAKAKADAEAKAAQEKAESTARAEAEAKAKAEADAKAAAEKAAAQAHDPSDHDDVITGTSRDDALKGDEHANLMVGKGSADTMFGGEGDDFMMGGSGDDDIAGDRGNDTMFGSGSLGGRVDMDKFVIAEDVRATITFNSETAGYQNALGMYKIAKDGSIHGVDILFANASLKGSGGSLVAGESSVGVDLKAGEKIGFFVVPNGYAQSGMAKLLADEAGSFKLVGADGNVGNVNSGGELKLIHVSAEGLETLVKSQYTSSVFHSWGGANGGLNGDAFKHVTGEVTTADGKVKIGFEDLWGGGDKDYDDSVFTVEIGQTNAALLAKESTGAPKSSDDDVMSGGEGRDKMFGMAGHDTMTGGAGDDAIYGNSGDDFLAGGEGNDTLAGGSGNDVMSDGDGRDTVAGNSGDDTIVAGEGDDTYRGDGGFDTLEMGAAKQGVNVDLNGHKSTGLGTDEVWGIEKVVGSRYDDVLRGDKRSNTLEGGDGNDQLRGMGGEDTLTGGAAKDVFRWLAKDVVDASGNHLGVDRVTDFQIGQDLLDLRDLVKGQKYGSIQDVVRVTESEKGAVVSVKLGADFIDVVTLDGVHASDLTKDGLILS